MYAYISGSLVSKNPAFVVLEVNGIGYQLHISLNTYAAIGDGTKDNPMTVKTGDVVLYGKYAGTEFTIDGKEYLIMRESDVIAII
jgi:hypothetical protein